MAFTPGRDYVSPAPGGNGYVSVVGGVAQTFPTQAEAEQNFNQRAGIGSAAPAEPEMGVNPAAIAAGQAAAALKAQYDYLNRKLDELDKPLAQAQIEQIKAQVKQTLANIEQTTNQLFGYRETGFDPGSFWDSMMAANIPRNMLGQPDRNAWIRAAQANGLSETDAARLYDSAISLWNSRGRGPTKEEFAGLAQSLGVGREKTEQARQFDTQTRMAQAVNFATATGFMPTSFASQDLSGPGLPAPPPTFSGGVRVPRQTGGFQPERMTTRPLVRQVQTPAFRPPGEVVFFAQNDPRRQQGVA